MLCIAAQNGRNHSSTGQSHRKSNKPRTVVFPWNFAFDKIAIRVAMTTE